MTRLIDLNDDRHTYCGDCGEYEMWSIDPDVPAVDAIPIEWILNHERMPKEGKTRKAIMDMIADWRADNETN